MKLVLGKTLYMVILAGGGRVSKRVRGLGEMAVDKSGGDVYVSVCEGVDFGLNKRKNVIF